VSGGAARPRKLVVAALIRENRGREGNSDGEGEHRGRILMSRRRDDQDPPRLWEFPGGKVEPGEAPDVALAREIREELGCGVTVGRIHDVIFHAYPEFDVYLLVYPCVIVTGSPRAIEVAEIAWVEPARLPTLDLLPADYPLARALAAGAL
jgi:8-oxo-dGTP diphosphatase